MNKIWIYICGICAIIAIYWFIVALYRSNKIDILQNKIESLQITNKSLKVEKEQCNEKVAKYNKSQSIAADKIEKVRTVVKTVKADCNCYDVGLPDNVLRLLHD